ncbi:hypothetical protein ACS4HS_002747 [Enterococcus hirae]
MYLPAILLCVLGTIFFIVNIFYFLKDYSLVINQIKSKKILGLNLSGILISFLMVLSGIVYFVLINQQL